MANDKNSSWLLHAKDGKASSPNWLSTFSLLAVALVFSILVKLGFWQLERAEDKSILRQQLATNQQIKLTEFPIGNIGEIANQQRISVSGRLLHQYTWLLDNQVKEGRVGYEVLVALALTNKEKLAIVNLGWIVAPQVRSQLPLLTKWPATQLFSGQLHVPVSNPYTLASVETNDWPKRIADIDFSMLEKHIGHEVYGAVLRLNQDNPIGYNKTWQWSNKMSADKHRAYAFQWFALAFTLFVLSAYFAFVSLRKFNG